jgi:hypothetical protein
MECRDVRELADSFLGEELLTETNHEILRHLEKCLVCRADVEARRTLRAAVQRAFHQARDLDPSPEFVARLRTTLREASVNVTVPARRRFRFHGWWVLAATVLLAIAGGLAYGRRDWFGATGALARAAAGDHRNCALQFRLTEKPISLEEAARRYGVAYRILEHLPPADVTTAGGSAHVLERHSCIYGGRRFAHIVFEYRGERVSLLVTAVEGTLQLTLPWEALPHVTSAGRIDDISVVSFRTAHHMVFFVGDVTRPDLMELADALADPLYRELTAVQERG